MHVHVLTLCDTAAEATLEAATSLHELHVRTHVGLATVATDGPALAVVHQVGRDLQTGDTSRPTRPYVSSPGPPSHPRITPILQHLRWLPVEQRIRLQLLLYTFKVIHNITPPHSCLISSTHLTVPPVPPQHHGGSRAFSRSTPKLWNSLTPPPPPRVSVVWTLHLFLTQD